MCETMEDEARKESKYNGMRDTGNLGISKPQLTWMNQVNQGMWESEMLLAWLGVVTWDILYRGLVAGLLGSW